MNSDAAAGIFGTAVSFNYSQTPLLTTRTYNLPNSAVKCALIQQHTLSVWFQVTSGAPTRRMRLLGFQTNAEIVINPPLSNECGPCAYIQFDWSSCSHLRFSTTSNSYFPLAPGMLTGDWVHLAVINSPTRTAYLNGELLVESCGYFGGPNQTQGTGSAVLSRLGPPLHSQEGVGNRNGGSAGEGFVGAIDELRIYDRTMNASEVAQLYACRPAKLTPPPPLCRCATFK